MCPYVAFRVSKTFAHQLLTQSQKTSSEGARHCPLEGAAASGHGRMDCADRVADIIIPEALGLSFTGPSSHCPQECRSPSLNSLAIGHILGYKECETAKLFSKCGLSGRMNFCKQVCLRKRQDVQGHRHKKKRNKRQGARPLPPSSVQFPGYYSLI